MQRKSSPEISPPRNQLSIVHELSPRQLVEADRVKSPFGIEGYEVALAANRSPKATIGKSKELNLIAMVSKRAARVPGVG